MCWTMEPVLQNSFSEKHKKMLNYYEMMWYNKTFSERHLEKQVLKDIWLKYGKMEK